MDFATRPSVLFVYFTYTNQTRKVIDAMAEVFRGRDFDVTLAAIEFTDPRYAGPQRVEGQPEGGYTDVFELICCDCGDDPDLDYCEVPAELQWVRGPCPIADGVAAYKRHIRQHRQLPVARQAATSDDG
jgi:hypothetical protein